MEWKNNEDQTEEDDMRSVGVPIVFRNAVRDTRN